MTGPAAARAWLVRLIACAALAVLAPGPTATAQEAEGSMVGVELNKLEQVGSACRSYMVLRNRTAAQLARLSLDLVVFDIDGLIDRRIAVELGPAAAGRTRVNVFDMPGLDCGRVARVLVNDVLDCQPDADGACAAPLEVSGRGDVALIR